jgi:DnaJ homologue, subfamily C, member 28, conserved domain
MKVGSFPDSQSAIRILKSGIKPMLPGFNKIIEERIRLAQKKGQFKNLAGSGKPLALEDDSHIAEELRLAYKILKNADCLPPEVELKKEIERTEELLGGLEDTAEKYRTLKKLNYLIMKLNSLRNTSFDLEMPQRYSAKLVVRFEATKKDKKQE